MTNSEFKSISAKISREEYTLIDDYCRKKAVTISSLIRELVLREINLTVPHHIAGANKIFYNKEKDNFNWNIELDDGTNFEIIKNVSANFFEELNENIANALMFREQIIKKKRKDSIPIPSSILGEKN